MGGLREYEIKGPEQIKTTISDVESTHNRSKLATIVDSAEEGKPVQGSKRNQEP